MNKVILNAVMLMLPFGNISCQSINEGYFNSLIEHYYSLGTELVCEVEQIQASDTLNDCSATSKKQLSDIAKQYLGQDTVLCNLFIGYPTKIATYTACSTEAGYPVIGIHPRFANSKRVGGSICPFTCKERLYEIDFGLSRYYEPIKINGNWYSGFITIEIGTVHNINPNSSYSVGYCSIQRLIPQEYQIENKHYNFDCYDVLVNKTNTR